MRTERGGGRPGRRAGFTLLELMVVMVILGILAATIVPQFIGTAQEAKVTAARADIKTLEGALERFYLHMDRYPTTEEGLKALVTPPADKDASWKGPYISALKPDPWKVPYNYRMPGTRGTKYDLWSRGADKTDGGEGDDGDIGNWPEEGAENPGGR
jgi:general secretion pathway protein G